MLFPIFFISRQQVHDFISCFLVEVVGFAFDFYVDRLACALDRSKQFLDSFETLGALGEADNTVDGGYDG